MESAVYFSLGLISSLHCLGMCGPIVLAYSGQLSGTNPRLSKTRIIQAHVLYNVGRICTYALIGGVMGSIGYYVDATLTLAGFQSTVAVSVGVLLILFGLMYLHVLPSFKMLEENTLNHNRLYRRIVLKLMHPDKIFLKFVLGLMLGFIPCMLTYAMFVKSLDSSGFLAGFTMLLLFGLGTIPALFLTGLTSSMITDKLKKWGTKLAGYALVLMGLVIFYRVLFMPLQSHTDHHMGM